MKRSKRITKEQKEEAVQIAIAGGDPVVFLDSCGIADAKKCWTNIKSRLKQIDPEQGTKIPDFRVKTMTAKEPKTAGEAMAAMKEAADTFFSQCEDMGLKTEVPTVKVDGPLKIETKEPEKVNVVKSPVGIPVAPPFEYRVTGIDTAIGSFQYFRKNKYLDWTEPNGETVSMHLEEWKEFMKLWPFVLKTLGVEL